MEIPQSQDPATQCATLVEILRHRACVQPDARALTFLRDGLQEIGHLTYRGLDMRARAIAARLQRQTAPGERALLLYPQGLDYASAFLGCLYAGVIAIPVYPPRHNQSLGRILSIIEDATPSIALSTREVSSRLEGRREQDGSFPAIPILDTDDLGVETQDCARSAGLWRDSDRVRDGDVIAYLQYTSGSTAIPKGVMVSHGNLLRNLLDMDLGWKHGEGSVLVTWLPFFHDMGLIYGILAPLYRGFPCYFMSPLSFLQRPARWLQAISHFRATHSVAPNFAYELCAQKLKPEEISGLDLRCWTVAVNGAEPVRHETLDRFAAVFGPYGFRYDSFCPGYGLAEATLKVTAVRKGETPVVITVLRSALERGRVLTSGSGEGDSRKLVGCGSSMIDTRVAIVNPERFVLCQPEEVGEIWLAGSTITRGYWNRPGETESIFEAHLADGEGPFLRTGDLGFMKDGELFITGRLKDLILIRGQNHYPQDIERVSEQSHPALKKPGFCAAFSVEYNNEERLVVVQEVGRPGADLDWEDIVGSIRQAISEEHDLQAYRIVLVKSGGVPRTTSGKVQRRACREAFLAGTLPVLYE